MKKAFNKVYIVSDEPFPVGMAPTNRIISYGKGFLSLGYLTKIIIFRKSEPFDEIINKDTKGSYQGIKFKYLSDTTSKSRFFIGRRFDVWMMAIRLFLLSVKSFNKETIVIYYSVHTYSAILLRVSSRIKKFKILKEEGEHPSVRTKLKSGFSSYLYLNIHYRLFDGFLAITNNLLNYFMVRFPNKPALHVHMIVDFERFNLNVEKEKLVTYCGTINKNKDGVDILIKAFNGITSEFPEYKLVLIGAHLSTETINELKKLIEDFDLKEKVILLGKIPNHQVPLEISKSEILVLPRPDSIQAKHGFPTKLGEYLATGNPVIVTSIGEIPLFLIDNENAYLIEPGNIKSLENKLLDVLRNPERAKIIGNRGRKTAYSNFNNKIETQKIIEFCYNL